MRSRYLLASLLILSLSAPLYAAPISLPDAINYALENNNTVKSSKARLDKTEFQIQEAGSLVYPTLKIGVSRTSAENYSTRQFSTLSSGTISSISNAYSATLTAKQLLYGSHVSAVLAVAGAARQSAQYEYQSAISQNAYDVKAAYYSVLKMRKLVEVSDISRSVLKSHLNQVTEFQKAGMSTQADILNVQVSLGNAEKQLLEALKGLALVNLQFNMTLGKEVDAPVDLDSTIDKVPVASPTRSVEEYVQIALNSRWDLKSLEKTKDLLRANVEVEASQSNPQLYLSGSYGYSNPGFSNWFTEASKEWMWGLNLSWTLFDGNNTAGRVAQANLDVANTDVTLDTLRRGISIEVREALLSIQLAKKVILTFQDTIKSANESVRLTVERYKAGGATNQEILNAQVARLQAQVSLTNAQFDLAIAQARLQKVLGQ